MDRSGQTSDSRQQIADSRQQAADSRQQTADSRQQTADSIETDLACVDGGEYGGQLGVLHDNLILRTPDGDSVGMNVCSCVSMYV
jgi:hypothetical protein